MIEVRPGLIPGHPEQFSPSYVNGKFRDEAKMPLEERIYPNRNLDDSIWEKGMYTFLEGPIYSPACGCDIMMVSLTHFDQEGLYAIFSVVIDIDFETKSLNNQNPYPDGKFYVITENDQFFISSETVTDMPATKWIQKRYGDAANEILQSTMEDGKTHHTELNKEDFFLYSTFNVDMGYYYFYAAPSESLIKDIKNIHWKIVIAAIISALAIIILCTYNAVSISELITKRNTIIRDVETAAKIQQSMLTVQDEVHNGFDVDTRLIPAKYIGGDLYCYLRQNDKLYFCVGDVAGKGIPAAMHMSKCISLFKNISRNGGTSADITTQLNREMCTDNSECIFVTSFIGVLDIKTGILDYCNAGHEKPLYWSGIQGEKPYYVELVSENIVLGIMDNYPYKSGKFKMIPGSILTQFTDGVDEANNIHNELFGKERLLDCFSRGCSENAENINETIITAVNNFVGKQQQSDDITLLTIKYSNLEGENPLSSENEKS